MFRRRVLFLLTLSAVLLVGFDANLSYGQRCRCGARQQSSCTCTCQPSQKCSQPCQKCCEPCGCYGGCKCINTVFYGYPGYYLHYARLHPDTANCPEFSTVIHQASTILDPTICPNCPLPGRYTTKTGCLSDPVPADFDIELRVIAPGYKVVKYLMGTAEVSTSSGPVIIEARLLLLKVKVGKPGAQHLELFAFGFEADLPDSSADELRGVKLTKQADGECIHQGKLYEGDVANEIPCFVVTKPR